MPAKNIYHDAVREALIADGWTITDDPLTVRVGLRRLYVDLAADRDRLGAERDGRRIAVEIQSFLGDSDIENLHHAVGQYVVYRALLRRTDPDRVLYLAVADEVYNDILSEPLGQTVIDDLGIRIVVFNAGDRRILEWRS
jgi:hypothetical protein